MFEEIRTIISPDEARQAVGLDESFKKIKLKRDEEIKDIISGRDKRLLLIIGPCSADNEDSVCDYCSRLSKVSEKVKDKIFIVPRIYTNKPRTRGEGYKGMLHSPDPHKKITDIQAGILAIRRMYVRAMHECGLSAADEMLYPENTVYCDDLLSYTAVGARSTENQQHRLVASGSDTCVGFKNPMNGSLSVLINSVYAAQIPNEFKYLNKQVRTTGNPYAHAILRGSVDASGRNIPNYHYEDVMQLCELYTEQGLKNPSIVIDTNHSNSGKRPDEQIRIAKEIVNNKTTYKEFGTIVKGLMIESYIEDGNQPPDGNVYGKSITDACLGWEKSERLIYDIADKL